MSTWASSERRTTDFSASGSLESRIEWKIVGCERSLCFVFVPDVREAICVSVFCFFVSFVSLLVRRKRQESGVLVSVR